MAEDVAPPLSQAPTEPLEHLQRLLYREFLAESDLYKEVGLERLPISLSALLGWPADEVIWRLAETTFVEELSLEQLATLFRIHDMELVSKTAATIARELREAHVSYEQAIRVGLAYAVTGMHAHAFAALRAAARKKPQWARHHYLYGVLAGLMGNHARAVRELERALEQEPYEDARQRVRAAIELLAPMRQTFPGY